jgi:DNA-binding MarR family transcriptional regulator
MSSEVAKTWLSLKQLLDQLESTSDYKAIDSINQRLLEWIYRQVTQGEVLYVQTIVMKSEVASPATIHKGLSILEEQGLISVKIDPTDTRRRIVKTTDRTERLMRKLSESVTAWAKEVS